MRAFYYSILIIVILIIIYIWIQTVKSRIDFKFNLKGADVSLFSIKDLFNQGESKILLKYTLEIINDNFFAIAFTDARFQLFYKNTLIAETDPQSKALNRGYVAGHGSLLIEDELIFYVNGDSIEFIGKFLAKENPMADYKLKFKAYGFLIDFQDKFELKQ